MTSSPTTVTVTEEVSPDEGLTREEIEQGIWNSPPAEKGQGRYRILGKSINRADFGKIRQYLQYWDREYLEETDMFFFATGWRINAAGLTALRDMGYTIDIDTLAAQKQRRTDADAKAKADRETELAERTARGEKFEVDISKYEAKLGNLKWGSKPPEYKHQTQVARFTGASDEQYVIYSYIHDTRQIHKFQQYTYDWYDNTYSVSPAPVWVQKEAECIKAEEHRERNRLRAEAEERRQHAIFFRMLCPSCSRIVYIRDATVENSLDGKVGCGKCSTRKNVIFFGQGEAVERKDIPQGSEVKE